MNLLTLVWLLSMNPTTGSYVCIYGGPISIFLKILPTVRCAHAHFSENGRPRVHRVNVVLKLLACSSRPIYLSSSLPHDHEHVSATGVSVWIRIRLWFRALRSTVQLRNDGGPTATTTTTAAAAAVSCWVRTTEASGVSRLRPSSCSRTVAH